MCRAKKILFSLFALSAAGLVACGSNQASGGESFPTETQTREEQTTGDTVENKEETTVKTEDLAEYFKGMKLTKSMKTLVNQNPIMTQRFGADPFAMVYGDRVYFYMTQDAITYEADGSIKENTYGNINTISVVSTDDMVNFTDHGQIAVAGKNGAAKWANNSWAPSAAWKTIDGKDKFFLYFADGGGGIGVVTSDSPTGPFVDEVGKGIIRRDMEMCGNVLWLFDPAVLVDDDGRAYIYFGGGVPEGKVSDPGTGRVAELGDDMMSLKGTPVAIDVPYLFEDSGIHKVGDTYYFSYCSNWQVDAEGTAKYGFHNAEIVTLESKNPMGPFTFKEVILKNPGQACGLYGNNHHAVFSFQGNWYITYHSRLLEKTMGIEKGYRATHVVQFEMGEDGTIGNIPHSQDSITQLKYVNPYQPVNATNVSVMAGTDSVPADEQTKKIGSGTFGLGAIDSGDYVKITGVDFGDTSAKSVKVTVMNSKEAGAIRVTVGTVNSEAVAYIPVAAGATADIVCEAELLKELTGVQDLYFTFYGEGYEIRDWSFTK